MKDTYRIPRQPGIACNGDLVVSQSSGELLSVLGFCNSEMQAEQEALEAETQALSAIESPSSKSDDDDHMYHTLIHFRTRGGEVDPLCEAM